MICFWLVKKVLLVVKENHGMVHKKEYISCTWLLQVWVLNGFKDGLMVRA